MFIEIGISDILDILIVAFILYQIYRLVKGTAAISIFAGIFTLYLVWLLVRMFNMELISTILGQFIGVGVIALLIVFQQEIRNFLLLVGSRYKLQNIFNMESLFAKQDLEDKVVDAVVRSCAFFSKEKTGALIAFEQNTGLAGFAKTGVMINANLTSELIENIFFKNTPLHDGAVLISHNKIVAARCILPVSDRFDIPGSMHLAATILLCEISTAPS